MSSNDQFFVRFRKSLVSNKGGDGARQMARRERDKAPVRTTLARVLGVHTDERAWRRGAEGEERVARSLLRLPYGWHVFHDITIGSRGSNIDHLAIGPGGVYALNTKNLTGKVWVGERVILHNGQKTDYLRTVSREASIATQRLSRAAGQPIFVVPVLVIFAKELKIKTPPSEVHIVEGFRIRRWLERRSPILLADQARFYAGFADDPTTWQSGR